MVRPRSRARRLALCLPAAVVGLLALAGPASAASYSPVPTFDCAAANGDGTFTYFFGYELGGTATVTLPVGPDNQFTSSNHFVGQPTTFSPGPHPDAFSVTTSDGNLQWHLDKTNIRVGSSTLCSNVPVVAEAPGALVMPAAAAAPFAVWFLVMRRRSRRATA